MRGASPAALRAVIADAGFAEEPSAFRRDYSPDAGNEPVVETVVETSVVIEAVEEAAPAAKAKPLSTVADRREQAKMRGYTGNSCSECGNFTMVRNGTCEKCETCGSTSGCS
jgi:ribonucleoside-diphosphate reductase alpha chain